MGEVVWGCRGCGRVLGSKHTMSCPEMTPGVPEVAERQCKAWSPAIAEPAVRKKDETTADLSKKRLVRGASLPKDAA